MTDRYARQISVAEIGVEGQARLRAATVLVVGAGGLGCAVLPYLAAAGIGRLVIVDHDRVEVSNLHRQPLYRTADAGRLKADVARETLLALNPDITVDARCERLTPANAEELIASADVIVDAADSFAATYISSDECLRAAKPLVSASVLGLTGYAGVFCANAPSYRAVFPELPASVGTCATAGVLGTAVAVMGSIQSHLALAMILNLQPSPRARLITVDFRGMRWGGFSFASAREPSRPSWPFVAPSQLGHSDITLDVRNLAQEDIERIAARADPCARIVLCCRSGVRAWRSATKLHARGFRNLALMAMGD